jgi:hypothetical protein
VSSERFIRASHQSQSSEREEKGRNGDEEGKEEFKADAVAVPEENGDGDFGDQRVFRKGRERLAENQARTVIEDV